MKEKEFWKNWTASTFNYWNYLSISSVWNVLKSPHTQIFIKY